MSTNHNQIPSQLDPPPPSLHAPLKPQRLDPPPIRMRDPRRVEGRRQGEGVERGGNGDGSEFYEEGEGAEEGEEEGEGDEVEGGRGRRGHVGSVYVNRWLNPGCWAVLRNSG